MVLSLKHDIINKILKQLEANPWNRRGIISLWDYQAFEESEGLLPLSFQTMFDAVVVSMGNLSGCDLGTFE